MIPENRVYDGSFPIPKLLIDKRAQGACLDGRGYTMK